MNGILIDETARYPDGQVASGLQAFVYQRGTSTPVNVYSTQSGVILHSIPPNFFSLSTLAQPLVTDSQGRLRFWLRPQALPAEFPQAIDISYVDPVTNLEVMRVPVEPFTTQAGPWINLPLTNCTIVSGRVSRYLKTSDNMVLVESTFTTGGSGSAVFFTLPAGYRPGKQLLQTIWPALFTSLATNGQFSIVFGAASTTYFVHMWFLAEN